MTGLDTFRRITKGAVRVLEENCVFSFFRFTEKQAALLEMRGFPRHINAGAGIRWAFQTHGGKIRFHYDAAIANGSVCGHFALDILLNGTPVLHVYRTNLPVSGEIEYTIAEQQTPVLVEVYFPNLAYMRVWNVELPEDITPVDRRIKLLSFGDSITQGAVTLHANHAYPNILANELNADLLNQGVGGDGFFFENLDEALPFNPDIITVAYGVNDFRRGALFSDAPGRYLEKLISIYPKKHVYVLLPVWFGAEAEPINGRTLQEGRAFIRDAYTQYKNVATINCVDFVPHLNEFYWDDVKLHPNDMGCLYYGHRLAKEIIRREGAAI